jgi:hypothetical protein
MGKKKFWWPTSMADQLVTVQNFQQKAPQYETLLGLDLVKINAICDAFIQSFNLTEQSRQSMLSMTAWRDRVMLGTPTGIPVEPAPVFPVVGKVTFTVGVVKQLFDIRDQIVINPNYTEAIGEDLGIVGAQISPSGPQPDIQPVIKSVTAGSGYSVQIKGSMQGMDAVRVEYAPNGGAFRPAAFLTNMPGTFNVVPTAPGQPESGRVRAVYIRKNAVFGLYSAEYPVTVS